MDFAGRVVQLCFVLEDHPGYQRVKGLCRDVLENQRSSRKRYFDLFMIGLVLTSVAFLIYGVENPPSRAMQLFENLAVSIFIAEYLARLWIFSDMHQTVIEHHAQAEFLNLPFQLGPALREIVRKKWEYVTSPLAIIDLLAILPSYRPIRLLRVFLLFRLFKLFRYARSIHGMAEVLSEKRFEFYTLILFMAFVVFAGSSAIYVFEGGGGGGHIDSFFDALYWSMVTLSTVGYGDIVPYTTEGRVVALALIVSGIGVLAFSTSIIVSAFQDKLGELRAHRVLSELERLSGYTVVCGYGEVAQVVVEKMQQSRQRFVIVEQNEEKVRLATRNGCLAVVGNATSNELLESLGIRERASTLLCITNNDVANVFITVSARQMNEGLRIIARANKREVVRKLTLAGANHVVAPFQIVGLMGAEYVGRPVAFEAIYGILRGERGVVLEALRVAEKSFIEGRTVGEVNFSKHKLLLFGVITEKARIASRSGHLYPLDEGFCFYFKPPADFTFHDADILVVFGYEFSILHFKRKMTNIETGRG